VVHEIDLTVGSGEVVALIGKNGMGKSTLLKSVMGIVHPTAGLVQVFGDDVRGAHPYQIARRGVSYIAQERALFSDLTVEENITLALEQESSLDETFDRIGALFPVLLDRRRQKAGTLSGGEQKMLLLARGITQSPRLLLLDEIAEGLQPSLRDVLKQVLIDHQQERGTSILLVEQDLRFAFSLASRYAVMKLGRISETGPTQGIDWREVAGQHLAI
jgi:branched-chain amino acid transport system ATP-binding protein